MSDEPRLRWADAFANVLITVLAIALDSVASALLRRRRSPAEKSEDPGPE